MNSVRENLIAARARGPELWGRQPGTGFWVQIDGGSHTDEEVARFESIYADAGWTDLRRTNPFAGQALVDYVWREICELPDRTSPEEYPDMGMVTLNELTAIVETYVETQALAHDRAIASTGEPS